MDPVFLRFNEQLLALQQSRKKSLNMSYDKIKPSNELKVSSGAAAAVVPKIQTKLSEGDL